MLDTMYRWCITAFNSGLWNIPTPVNQVLDGHTVQTHVKIDAVCEHGGCLNCIQGRNLGTCCICCVTKDHWEPSACSMTQIMCASDQATTYTMTPPSTATLCRERVNWRVEWHHIIFSDESRFCLHVSEGCTRVQRRPGEHHLPQGICPRHTDPTSGFMVWGVISYNSQSHMVFLQGEVNSALYIAQVVNPILCHIIDWEMLCFFSRTMHVHIQLLWHNMLFVVYNYPGQQDPQISCQLNTEEYIKDPINSFTLSPEPATIIAELWQWVQYAWENLAQDDSWHLYDCLHARIHVCIAARGSFTVYWCDCLGTLYSDMCVSIGLNL